MKAIVLKSFKKLWKLLQIPTLHKINGIKLWLPPEHLLPKYKSKYPLYDEFLPVLANVLPDASCVVDVGANVGDTCLSMYKSNSSLNFICVEPDHKFFLYLKFNTRQLPVSKVKNKKFLITQFKDSFKLSGNGGTKSMKKSRIKKYRNCSLDYLLEIDKPASVISLIKSDIDGHDFDVILSGKQIISEIKPLVYFEFMFISYESLNNYLKSIIFLISAGYSKAYVFKNTGEFEKSLNINELEKYIRTNVNSYNRFSKVSYYDVLFSAENYTKIAEEAVNNYQNNKLI